MVKTIALVSLLAAATNINACAQTLHPIHAETIEMGTLHGSAYFEPKADGYHLVTTLMSGDVNSVVRFTTVLSDGQSASVSVPGPVGAPAHEIIFERSGDELIVHHSTKSLIAAQ